MPNGRSMMRAIRPASLVSTHGSTKASIEISGALINKFCRVKFRVGPVTHLIGICTMAQWQCCRGGVTLAAIRSSPDSYSQRATPRISAGMKDHSRSRAAAMNPGPLCSPICAYSCPTLRYCRYGDAAQLVRPSAYCTVPPHRVPPMKRSSPTAPSS